MSVDWTSRYSRRLEWMTTSIIREILKSAQSPDVISMSGGWPDASLFPVDKLGELANYVMEEQPAASLQYGVTDGYIGLRQQLVDFSRENGIHAGVNNIAITSGTQQTLDLAGRLFLDEGDVVIVESPTFLGALQAFKAYGCKFAPVPVDDEGMCIDELETALKETKASFIYAIPNFQNPTGVTMSLERRKKVVELADKYGVPILEDDPYGLLRFDGEFLPSLFELDAALHPENAVADEHITGNVIYASSFSKILAPGLRISWLVAPPSVKEQFIMAKQGADVQSNALAQAIASEFLRLGYMPDQLDRIREHYLVRCNAMCDAVDEILGDIVTYVRPEGGLFLWLELNCCLDTIELLKIAAKENVAFVPGAPFYTVPGVGKNTLRLSFATMDPDMIYEGIRRLRKAIDACSE